MKLSKETEQEIRQVYQTYWDAYLGGDFETFASFLDDAIVIYGTAVGEIFTTKEEAVKFYTATGEEMTGKAEFRNRNITLQAVGDAVAIYEQSHLYILIEDQWTFYGAARISGILEKKSDGWKLVHQHGSFPDGRTEEGQQIASEKIKEENLRLREAVHRRTVELENKNHELEIEAALERVRARAMSMRKPDDMLSVCETIAEQLDLLNVKHVRNVQTAIISGASPGYYINYQYFTPYQKGIIEHIEIGKHPRVKELIDRMQASTDAYFPASFTGKELDEWRQYRKDDNQFPDPILDESDAVYFHFYSIGQGGIGISTYAELQPQDVQLFHRFRNVFALAYQRFRDIEQAEMQAREAHIEAALERLRSRSMAMQHSDELTDVVKLLYQEFDNLKISNESTDIEIGLINEETGIASVWAHLYQSDGTISTFSFPFAHFDEINHEFQQWKNTTIDKRNELFITTEFSGDLWNKFIVLANEVPELAEMFRSLTEANITKWVTHNAYFSHGLLTLQGVEAYPAETLEIQKRFARVFEQTYIRFLDLQKAEAQTREAQIELALERVRARTMAMQRSEELHDTSLILFEQLKELGEPAEQCTIGIIKESEGVIEISATLHGNKMEQTFRHKLDEPFVMAKMYKHWKDEQKSLVLEIKGEELQKYNQYRNELVGADIFPVKRLPGDRRIIHIAYFSKGILALSTNEPRPAESVQLLERFAIVFEQTYTRFLDLQKAEALAREAQIEAALERVRSRTMAMQKSNELRQVIHVVYDQLRCIDIPIEHTGFILDYKEREDMLIWLADYFGSPFQITIPYFDSPHWNSFREAKAKGISFFSNHLTQDEKNRFYRDLFAIIPSLPEDGQQAIFEKPGLDISTVLLDNVGLYMENYSGTPFTEEQNNVLIRFGNVFQQAYTRFLDLQKAEAQAREAQIEAGLERIRSRTMAMQSCDELSETAAVTLQELIKLGVAPNRLYIALIENDQKEVHFYLTSEDGRKDCSVYTAQINRNISVQKMYDAWAAHQPSITLQMEGNELAAYLQYLREEVGVPYQTASVPQRRVQTIAYFSQGYIGIVSNDDQPAETTKLLERFAAVFNLTYTRFNDLKHAEKLAHQANLDLIRLKEEKIRTELALAELKAAQAQLIQSEKMASLGELTAGIAHEIQNPLNFVNNFSEVSSELLDEMKQELATGNKQEAMDIADDVKQNLEKILMHGKRADGIVKGMLMHSRSSSGIKEPTDINALADEYLRLAYHGMRAKDKAFNATIKTDFDDTIGKINVIPQDIGRVLLNLITNAFHAVSATKSPRGDLPFIPTVTIQTKLLKSPSGDLGANGASTVLISIRDNGTGIPDHIKDKIFQPFFTTKPTGQGTGLGLSLSYDIIKAHGGNITLETKEGIGSTFTITLPDETDTHLTGL